MIHIEIDDKQIQQFIKKSPARANWAIKEAFGKAGGHYRKKLKMEISSGKYPLAPLSEVTTRGRAENRPPLELLNRLIFFKVRRIKKMYQQLTLGFMAGAKGLGKRPFGGKYTIIQIAKMHTSGKRTRVTDRTRGRFARMGFPLKKETKVITIPARPVIDFFYNRYKRAIPKYIEKAFFDIFFSKRNQRLKI